MQIAVVQMQIVDGNPAANRSTVLAYLSEHAGYDLYLLPELWTTGYVQQEWSRLATQDTPATLVWMSEQARERRIWLAGSVIAANADGTLANRFVMFDRNGALACQYDKAHLFHPLDEHIYLRAGAAMPPVVEAEGVRLSPAICYDLRFPEMFRRNTLRGVDVFLVSSAWPFPRQHALNILTEARAIENQAIVALANRIGVDAKGNHFCGGSGVFGPIGPLSEMHQAEGVAVADIDPVALRELRKSFPVLEHRLERIDHD